MKTAICSPSLFLQEEGDRLFFGLLQEHESAWMRWAEEGWMEEEPGALTSEHHCQDWLPVTPGGFVVNLLETQGKRQTRG